MKHYSKLLPFLYIMLLSFSCSKQKGESTDTADASSKANTEQQPVPVPQAPPAEEIWNIDLNQDLSNKSLQELRILRNAVYAKQGFLFMQADMRGFFSANMKRYDSLMEARWLAEDDGKPLPPIKLSPEEEKFVAKIKELEQQKLAQNYVMINNYKLANVENVVNYFQYQKLDQAFLGKLKENNFVIVPGNNVQLFHLYEQNDYHQIPNFVTTDLYLQLFHMYFSYLLKTLEQDKFIPLVTEIASTLNKESLKIANTSSDPALKSLAEYNAAFYAIPYSIITGKKPVVPQRYQKMFEEELQHIDAEQDDASEFLEYKEAPFPYSLFKPRGHYTRTANLKKYFKAMMWLQTAPYCRTDDEQFRQAILVAYLLNNSVVSPGKPLIKSYNALYDPVAFIIGEPDNLSIADLATIASAQGIKDLTTLTAPATIEKINQQLLIVGQNRNRIKPNIEMSCRDKINFLPQRYLVDNEIIQELVDVKVNAKRAFPKGLDVFAAFGEKKAEDLLLNFYKEEENWKKYPETLNKLKKKFENYNEWDKSVYNKWIQSLLTLVKVEKNYPLYMQTEAWGKKNMNTALASWAELKHDAILYAEQPMAAECGDGGPPPPITVGYVEPNVSFWKRIMELARLTEDVLAKNDLMTEDIQSKTQQIKENAGFLLSASEKELRNEKLTEQEYNTIEILGSSIEYLTLSIIEPGTTSWENVKGPDKSVAVVADVYTRNIPGDEKNGILHVGVGNVNDIYVVVEIEEYLYLTKGATFSYYEFVEPLGSRLTDEEWQKRIEDNKLPPIPKWMEDIIVPSDKKPAVDEKVFYSSGC